MKKKTALIVTLAILCAAAIGIYFYFNVDMTGASFDEIEAYRLAHPNKNITYTVIIDGGDTPIKVTNESTEVALTEMAQVKSLIAQSEYLQHLDIIFFGRLTPDAEILSETQAAFPDTSLHYDNVMLLGNEVSAQDAHLTLEGLAAADLPQAAKELPWFPNLTTVTVTAPEDSTYTAADAAILASALPDVTVNMTFDLFGQTVSTDMERIEYFKADIGGDAGLDVIRSVMPIMDKLTYLRLDWCGTTDEATAALREELKDTCKVVWRVFFADFNCLTDTYKIWAQYYLWTRDLGPLQYCNEVRYIDMGHSFVDSCEFVKYMPYLDTLILADCSLRSIEPLRTCKNLTYLEIFTTNVVDLSPLADLPQLEYLNISNVETTDISPLYGLTNLKKMNSTMNEKIPRDQIEEFKRRLPDCDATFTFADESPTEYGWRRAPAPPHGIYLYTPRYALLRQQIGYDTKDYSRYPKGHLTEEVTYESTGILPPEEYYKEENYE